MNNEACPCEYVRTLAVKDRFAARNMAIDAERQLFVPDLIPNLFQIEIHVLWLMIVTLTRLVL